MPIVVQKYGGTSVGDTDRIRGVADRIVRAREQGQDVVVVVSAMGETTDDLLDKASDITPAPEPRELDMLLTAGERIAMSLLAIAVNARGCRAASYTGSQAGIITDTQHGKARIVEIRPTRIKESLDAGNVVILAGFQGLSTEYDITTLGRGGSDTTAVAMAAALGAEVCEIYTDVDGVFTATPGPIPRPAGSTASPTRRCSSSPPPARGSSSCGAWSTLGGTASGSTFGTPWVSSRARGSTKTRRLPPGCSRAP
jgi:aspartate kinase